MDFHALQAFVAVAEETSFSRAAEQLHLTQPAISKRIATLESELGTRLFDRIGRQLSLAPTGSRPIDIGAPPVDTYGQHHL